MKRPYIFTLEDRKLIGDLLLELATELDLHYGEEDLPSLAPSFVIMKEAIALLERASCNAHPDVIQIVARFNKARQ